MRYFYLSLVTLLAFSSIAFGSACTDECDSRFTIGEPVTFCATDGLTYNTKISALYTQNGLYSSCYMQCNVAVLYVGRCGCPNECSNATGHGVCVTSSSGVNSCSCSSTWGGNDCSMVKCAGANSCSGHGTCVTQTASKGGDYCSCAPGWTSHDCSVQIPQFFNDHPYGSLTFGEVPDAGNYYNKDKYNDAHPFFNYTTIATVKVTLSDADMKYMLNPSTIYDVDYVAAKLFFWNGNLSKSSDITFRVKGLSSRLMVKKSWNVKFPKDNDYKDLKGFSLKSNIFDAQAKSQLMWDIYRSQKVQTYRHAHAQLYINNIFFGLVSLEERIDDAWMESRYNINEKKEANLWKLSPYSLQYAGDTVDDYKNLKVKIFNDQYFNVVEQEEGNGDWNDLLDLVLALNSSSSIAVDYINENFDVDGLVRAWSLETAFRNSDASLGTGNNWYLVDTKEGPKINWEFVAFDFDTAMVKMEDLLGPSFGMTGEQLLALMDSGVTVLYGLDLTQLIQQKNPYNAINRPSKPLAKAMLSYPGYNASFTAFIKKFVQNIIINNPGRAEEVRKAHTDLVRPIVATDLMYRISNTPTGLSLATFDANAAATKAWIAERWAYLSNMFYVNGNGQCDDKGNCVCNEGYFGKTCDQFCGVEFQQTKTNSWNDGSKDYTQWNVNVAVGNSALRSKAFFNVAGSDFTAWNLEKQADGSYSLPAYQYNNNGGSIPANSSSISFGYTVSSMNAAKFTLKNNACAPTTCSLAVSTRQTGSWSSGNTAYAQYEFVVQNTASSSATELKVKLDFQSGSYVSSSWNIAPSSSSPSAQSETFTLSLYSLGAGQTSTSNGFVVASPSTPSFALSTVTSYCL